MPLAYDAQRKGYRAAMVRAGNAATDALGLPAPAGFVACGWTRLRNSGQTLMALAALVILSAAVGSASLRHSWHCWPNAPISARSSSTSRARIGELVWAGGQGCLQRNCKLLFGLLQSAKSRIARDAVEDDLLALRPEPPRPV